jgi:hypothetical protein
MEAAASFKAIQYAGKKITVHVTNNIDNQLEAMTMIY